MDREVILDSDGCSLKLYRNLLTKEELEDCYSICEEYCTKRYPITMHGKEVIQPRTNCAFVDLETYGNFVHYSTTKIEAYQWHPLIYDISRILSTRAFTPNMCLVNGYITKEDYVGAHRDKKLLDELKTVCTVSLGGTRRMIFKPYEDKSLEKIEIQLNHGDVLYMRGRTNEIYTHEIAKIRKKDNFAFKPRYSLTFREMK